MQTQFYITLLFSILSIVVFSQEKIHFDMKIEYEVAFIPDTFHRENVMIEHMELLHSDSMSIFRSANMGKNDSLSYSIEDTRKRVSELGGEMVYPSFFKTHFPYTLHFDSNQIYHIEQLADFNKYIYVENLNQMDWDIKDEIKIIDDLKCQMAILNYGGRRWEAWFTTQIPIFLGPYKFSGLPGLIVAIKDSTNSWKFKLSKIERGKIAGFLIHNRHENKLIKINRDEFFKKKRYLLDNSFEIRLASGRTRFANEKAKKMVRDSALEKALRDNNWIEFYQ